MRLLRTYFISGLIVLLPVVATIYIFVFVFRFIDGLFRQLIIQYIGYPIAGLGFALTITTILVVGMLATNFIGKKLIKLTEAFLTKLPIVRTLYSAVKQLTDSIFIQRKGAFKQVVLVEYPRQGMYAIGFVTGEGAIKDSEKTPYINVFIPMTPNPTSGMLVVLPEDRLIPSNLSVEEGLKLVISGGILTPEETTFTVGP